MFIMIHKSSRSDLPYRVTFSSKDSNVSTVECFDLRNARTFANGLRDGMQAAGAPWIKIHRSDAVTVIEEKEEG